MKFLSVFAVVFALAPMTAKSQSMQEFLQSSYDNHPELLSQIQSAYQRYEGAYRPAVGGILPTLDYTYRSTYTRGVNQLSRTQLIPAINLRDTATFSPETTANRRDKSYTWTLTQNLFDSFSDYFELRQFLDTAYAIKMSYYENEQAFMQNAIEAYLSVIRADNIVKVRQANLASLQERLNIVERLYSVGDSTELDLRQSSAQLLTAESDLEDATAQYEGALATFRRFGAIEAQKNNMALPALPEGLPASLEEGEELVIRDNFNLRRLDATQKASKSAYRAALGQAGISVDFRVDYGTNRVSSQGIRGGPTTGASRVAGSDSTTSSVTVSVPVYNPQRSSAIRQSHKAYLQSKSNYTSTRLSNIDTFQSDWASYTRLTKSVQLRKEAMESAEIALENVVLQQRAGLRSIVEVLDEESRLIQAQVAYENARYNYLTTAYRLQASTGKLTAKDLGLQTKYGEKLASYFTKQKYLGSLPGIVTAVQGLGGEFLDQD